MKIVIVGGVAGGASAAAKARRVNEKAEIVMFERGPHVSFANCGLPYYVGGQITDRRSLLLQTPKSFWNRFRVDVRVMHEVIAIDRKAKKVTVKKLESGELFDESYDKLILAPGASAIVPDLPGIKADNIFTVRTVPDSDAIRDYISQHRPLRAVVVGAGFIGLEAAEVLKRRGLEVTVVELMPQVLPPFDVEVAHVVERHLGKQGITVVLSDGIKSFEGGDTVRNVELQSGRRIPADLVVLSIGVRPELLLAQNAGLELGKAGGIAVDERQQTSDPDIFAAGDAVEVLHLVTGRKARIPLAGPANKQGRVAGANAVGGNLTFKGVLGTAIVETMGIAAAKTGLSEREARDAGIPFFVSTTHSLDHAGYYPGGELLLIKLVAEQATGRLLGAQVVGEAGVDKRIDVLATALGAGMSVSDLENLDLAYAPQFSSAKDPVIIAGFAAANVVRNEIKTITCEELRRMSPEKLQLVDVRTPTEHASGHLENDVLIPIDELRNRLGELDPQKDTVVYCKIGLRGYLAARILLQNGFSRVRNLTGGILVCGEDGRKSSVRTNGGTESQVSVLTLKDVLSKQDVLMMDVREADEFAFERIKGTQNFPLSSLSTAIPSLSKDKDIYVLCQTGVRTAEAVARLRASGLTRVHAVEGGVQAWKKAALPLERSGGPIPVMRQVQIVAGSLALLGGLVPDLRWIAIIIGAGLMFAGFSGWCGLALVLAKMPWNKRTPVPNRENSCGSCG